MPFFFKFLDNEDDPVKLATEASHKIKLQPGQQAQQELFHLTLPSIKAKREQKNEEGLTIRSSAQKEKK